MGNPSVRRRRPCNIGKGALVKMLQESGFCPSKLHTQSASRQQCAVSVHRIEALDQRLTFLKRPQYPAKRDLRRVASQLRTTAAATPGDHNPRSGQLLDDLAQVVTRNREFLGQFSS